MELLKTHYERVLEYLTQQNLDEFFYAIEEKLKDNPDPTYQEFVQAAIIEGAPDNPTMANYVNIFFHLYHMKKNGEKIYHATPELAARLAGTSLNIDAYFLKSPFREIFVQVDPDLFSLQDTDNRIVPVNGFYVYLRQMSDHIAVRIMAVALLKPTADLPFNDSTFYFRLEIYPGKIRDQVSAYIKKNIEKKGELVKYAGVRNVGYLEEFTSFVFNLLLYVTSKSPDLIVQKPQDYTQKYAGLKNPAKKRKLMQRAQRETGRVIVIAGSSVKSSDVDAIRKSGSIAGWKLSQRVKVSGYWRSQWYGSDKDQSKRTELIWIDDYEKGPEMADLIHNPYIVK